MSTISVLVSAPGSDSHVSVECLDYRDGRESKWTSRWNTSSDSDLQQLARRLSSFGQECKWSRSFQRDEQSSFPGSIETWLESIQSCCSRSNIDAESECLTLLFPPAARLSFLKLEENLVEIKTEPTFWLPASSMHLEANRLGRAESYLIQPMVLIRWVSCCFLSLEWCDALCVSLAKKRTQEKGEGRRRMAWYFFCCIILAYSWDYWVIALFFLSSYCSWKEISTPVVVVVPILWSIISQEQRWRCDICVESLSLAFVREDNGRDAPM